MYGMTVFQNEAGNFVMFGSILDWAHVDIHRWEYDLSTYDWRYVKNELRNGYDTASVVAIEDNAGGYVRVTENAVGGGGGLYFSGGPGTPGNFLQGGAPLAMFQNHAPGNFNYEIFAVLNGALHHTWIVHGTSQWNVGQQLGQGTTRGVAAFQNNAPGNLNYEVFIVQDGHLRHSWRDWTTGTWFDGGAVGPAAGPVAAFQNMDPQSKFNYEVFVVEGGNLRHWWRDWNKGSWVQGQVLGPATDEQGDGAVSAFFNARNRNDEVFALAGGVPQHWWRDANLGKWFSGDVAIDMSPKN